MQLRNFTAAPGLVNLKVSYFVFFFFFFKERVKMLLSANHPG